MVNMILAHTKVNGWAKYEQYPWNIVDYRVTIKVGRMDEWTEGQAEGQMDRAGHDNTLQPK